MFVPMFCLTVMFMCCQQTTKLYFYSTLEQTKPIQPFIKTQIVRSDINSSLYYDRFVEPEIEESIRSWRGLPSEDEEIPDDEEDNVV
mmetsp:Transcript_41332/g.62667  ORF Transcript_41332/g.62667 Transcript_41332/m.62667 type:complete len:87 (-) Transcript_41332:255-515(-)